MHNLKNIEVQIPHGQMTVITGLSGSGKSTLAFDTLYAEGQRRYIESLSSYARQFLGKLDKPDLDFIHGIAPAIAIEQKVISTNPRSTVGTVTEIYDYLKLLFARVGRTYSPISGNEVKKHQVSDVVSTIFSMEKGTKLMIVAPISNYTKYGLQRQLTLYKEQGYSRVLWNNTPYLLTDLIEEKPTEKGELALVVDRIVCDAENEENTARIADSVQLAFLESDGFCEIHFPNEQPCLHFSNRFELDGMSFIEPSLHFFTFNNPFGACGTCEGFGSILGIDPELVIPDKNLSVYQGAVLPWKGDKMGKYLDRFIQATAHLDFPIHRPVKELSDEEYDLLWNGKKGIRGVSHFFKDLEAKLYKIYNRVLLAKYRGKTVCPDCKGTRLRKDANNVKVGGHSISEIVLNSIEQNIEIFENLRLNEHDAKLSDRILKEIINRLNWLNEVGLGYLSLNRRANSLSGGESQRINLATSLGSSLVGSMYILDEPSIGLHPKDTSRLINVLQSLKKLGNTVIIVEHEEAIMQAADEILDIGPAAGVYGGEIVFQGKHKALLAADNSLTAAYLTGKKQIPIPSQRRKTKEKIIVEGARENNLKNITVHFPLNQLVCVTGVSGSGKSTLVKQILLPAVKRHLGIHGDRMGKVDCVTGSLNQIEAVEFIDQNPIGRSSRSNPVTYVKAFDEIRELFARTKQAKALGLKAGYFSFNVPGGRCEDCEGEGQITVSMQFMADVNLTCETCGGKRYKDEALLITYKGKNISEILEMNIGEALDFFQDDALLEQKIRDKIQPLYDVGLEYLSLGQPSSTLSGGEAQRVKLASFLQSQKHITPTLFIFDEPTTGLHFHDIAKLLIAFDRLVQKGHTLVVIEHDMDVVKCADTVIDLGPQGGDAGGSLVFIGTPEELVDCSESLTAPFLKEKLGVRTTQSPND